MIWRENPYFWKHPLGHSYGDVKFKALHLEDTQLLELHGWHCATTLSLKILQKKTTTSIFTQARHTNQNNLQLQHLQLLLFLLVLQTSSFHLKCSDLSPKRRGWRGKDLGFHVGFARNRLGQCFGSSHHGGGAESGVLVVVFWHFW